MKPTRKNRSRAYYRHHRNRVIQRKTKIAKHTGWYSPFTGYFAKGKVHCSCSMCTVKSKKDRYPHSQMVQLETLNSQLHDYIKEEER